MRTRTLTRRQFLAASGLALVVAGKQQCALENDALRFGIAIGDRTIWARSFENKLVGQSIPLPTEEFLLEFDDGSTVSSGDLELRLGAAGDRSVELLFSAKSGLEVRVRYHLAPQARYLRKQISVRHERASGRLLRVDLENWRGVRRGWDSMHADRFPHGSHPVFCDNLWAGVEFVAAFNVYGSDGFTLRSRPGGVPLGSEWVDLHSTVVGIANYISPWILKYSDTVWANAEDGVVGIGPAPEYRESHTNAREFMVFRSLEQVWLPQPEQSRRAE